MERSVGINWDARERGLQRDMWSSWFKVEIVAFERILRARQNGPLRLLRELTAYRSILIFPSDFLQTAKQ
jgi:hypothetical protein